jgi:hypothetical protein
MGKLANDKEGYLFASLPLRLLDAKSPNLRAILQILRRAKLFGVPAQKRIFCS